MVFVCGTEFSKMTKVVGVFFLFNPVIFFEPHGYLLLICCSDHPNSIPRKTILKRYFVASDSSVHVISVPFYCSWIESVEREWGQAAIFHLRAKNSYFRISLHTSLCDGCSNSSLLFFWKMVLFLRIELFSSGCKPSPTLPSHYGHFALMR